MFYTIIIYYNYVIFTDTIQVTLSIYQMLYNSTDFKYSNFEKANFD